MNAHRFDQLAKTCVAASSRRSVIGGLLGGVLGLSRISAAGAGHKTGHHCTPSDHHPCENGECREVNGEWTCQDTCRAAGEPCTTDVDCCEARRCCEFQCVDDNCDGED